MGGNPALVCRGTPSSLPGWVHRRKENPGAAHPRAQPRRGLRERARWTGGPGGCIVERRITGPNNCLIHWSVIYLISEWVIRLTMLAYVPRQRRAAAARTWLLLIFLLPWPGIFFYALVGRIYLPKQRLVRQQQASQKIRIVQEQMLSRCPPQPSAAQRHPAGRARHPAGGF